MRLSTFISSAPLSLNLSAPPRLVFRSPPSRPPPHPPDPCSAPCSKHEPPHPPPKPSDPPDPPDLPYLSSHRLNAFVPGPFWSSNTGKFWTFRFSSYTNYVGLFIVTLWCPVLSQWWNLFNGCKL